MPLPVTAVGDPAQAIYGWRGASAANLPRFTERLPARGQRPHVRARRAIRPADQFPQSGRGAGTGQPDRRSRCAAGTGRRRPAAERTTRRPATWRAPCCTDVRQERGWLAEPIARRWRDEHRGDRRRRRPPPCWCGAAPTWPSSAQRCGRVGLPVEVVGIGGLLAEPEIRDLVSTLRLLVDPLAGTAAMRLLTNSRWRVGAADLAALWRRAAALAGTGADEVRSGGLLPMVADAMPHGTRGTDRTCRRAGRSRRADRLLGGRFPADVDLGDELAALRRRLEAPLPELVADVERTLMLDIEAMARPGGVGRVHLDAFADVVARFRRGESRRRHFPRCWTTSASRKRKRTGSTPGEVAGRRRPGAGAHRARGQGPGMAGCRCCRIWSRDLSWQAPDVVVASVGHRTARRSSRRRCRSAGTAAAERFSSQGNRGRAGRCTTTPSRAAPA